MLHTPLENLFSIHSATQSALQRKEIHTGEDLIYYFPRRYEDRSSLQTIRNAITSENFYDKNFAPSIIAQCLRQTRFVFRGREVKRYHFSDSETSFSVIAYNPWQRFKIEEYYMLSGKIRERQNEIQMTVNEYESFDEESVASIHLGRTVGIYSTTENLTQKQLRTMIEQLLKKLSEAEVSYKIPEALAQKKHFRPKLQNVQELHFPTDETSLDRARTELAYEELFALEKILATTRKKNISGKLPGRYPTRDPLDKLIAEMPFTLTSEQEQALKEILIDMASPEAMHRLVHGEVGSGKTLLAALSMYCAHINGYQSALMAPTEILVMQHVEFFKKFFAGRSVPIATLVAYQNQPKELREEAAYLIRHHPNAMIIGTHALIQKEAQFPNLRYVIIDEQHRFGVEQRQAILKKGEHPDFLSLTATPIPRSLCLTLYGDLSISRLKTRPKSAMNVHTKVIDESERPHAYKFLKQRVVKENEQAYVVFPVIEESSSKRLRSLTKEFALLKEKVFPETEIAFIHGKMKAKEKQVLMEQFHAGVIRILFATTVLEVGIDNPNATVIIIESSHQFGLSQLHQLRGRVGRHLKEGYCYLVTKDDMNPETYDRLRKFAKMQNGFEIAELDFRIRGPGEMTGSKQSGLPPLKIADIIKDEALLLEARKDAYEMIFP